MGRKNVVPSYKMFDAVALSASRTSEITNVQNLDKASVLLEWTAGSSPVGVVTVEARQGANGNWTELDMGSAINISGASGNHQLVFNELPFTDIRLQYTRSSGDATLTATFTGKQVGG